MKTIKPRGAGSVDRDSIKEGGGGHVGLADTQKLIAQLQSSQAQAVRELHLQHQRYNTIQKERDLLETSLRKKQDEVDQI